MDFNDVKGVVRQGELPIESVENPYGDYYIVKIKNDAGLTWVPGEHGIYTLPNKQIEVESTACFRWLRYLKKDFY